MNLSGSPIASTSVAERNSGPCPSHSDISNTQTSSQTASEGAVNACTVGTYPETSCSHIHEQHMGGPEESDQQPPALIVVEDPAGDIFLGVDPVRWEKELEEIRRNAPPQVTGIHEEFYLDIPDSDFLEEHHLLLVSRRRKGCIFLLAMDIAYLVFLGIVPFLNASWTQHQSSLDRRYVERTLIQVSFFACVDATGILACARSSVSLLSVFIIFMSIITVLSAVNSLSPVLVFRMIIIMLAMQLRSSIIALRQHRPTEAPGISIDEALEFLRRRTSRILRRRQEGNENRAPDPADPAAEQRPPGREA
mmetsp:Transcript_12774/g.30284  ORF Transcript_12774/g.30284 Transcript_12774/m.30284 type:complete len:307 (-) Transcript_12774:181-1101(-)